MFRPGTTMGFGALVGLILSCIALACSHTAAGPTPTGPTAPANLGTAEPSVEGKPPFQDDCEARCEHFRSISDCEDEQGRMVPCPCACP